MSELRRWIQLHRLASATSIGLLFPCLTLLIGCEPVKSERVYVDLDRVLAAEPAPPAIALPVIHVQPLTGPLVVKQSGLPATSTTDRTEKRLETAKQLIAKNRSDSIAALSSMLKRVYLARAEDEIAKIDNESQPQHDTILSDAVERVRKAFDAYSAERGPLLLRLNLLARNTNLQVEPVPDEAVGYRKTRIEEANRIRDQIRSLDARYDAEAGAILTNAEKDFRAEVSAVQKQAQKARTDAEAKAISDAERQATVAQTSLDVQLTKLVPESLPAVPSREVTVPGPPLIGGQLTDKHRPLFGSLEERRRTLDREIEIWTASTGRTRSANPKGVRDATEDFLRWKSAHRVGP